MVALPFHLPVLLRGERLAIIDRELDPVIVVFNATAGLFGLLGALAVFGALALAGVRVLRGRVQLTSEATSLLLFSALTSLLYLGLFLRLPDEAAYLIPALLTPFLLIVLASPQWLSGLVATALLVGCFLGSIARADAGPRAGRVQLQARGPVLRAVEVQTRASCIADRVGQALAVAPRDTIVIAGDLRPQLAELLGEALALRIFYAYYLDATGRLVWYPARLEPSANAAVLILDRAFKTLEPELHNAGRPTTQLDTITACPDG